MNTIFETNFTVFPKHTNDHYPLIFGGSFASEIDICAAQTARRFLHASESCSNAVTHKWNIEFLKPTYSGDLIFLRGEVVGVGKKSIVINVVAEREKAGKPGRDLVAKASFIFISIKDGTVLHDCPDMLPYHPHGLELT